MPRGPDPTTRRSPTQGGRELRARVSGEEYARVQAAAEAERMTVPAYVRGMVLGARHRNLLPAVMAEVEPVQLDRPLPMAEAVEERSCFTCAHDRVHHVGIHACCAMGTARGIYAYTVESGCHSTPDGMPTDRTLKCPGWAAKETT